MGIEKTGNTGSRPEPQDTSHASKAPDAVGSGLNRKVSPVPSDPLAPPSRKRDRERDQGNLHPESLAKRTKTRLTVNITTANETDDSKNQVSQQTMGLLGQIAAASSSRTSQPETQNEFSIFPIENHDATLWAHQLPKDNQMADMWLLAEKNNIDTIIALETGFADYKRYSIETDDYKIEVTTENSQPLSSIQTLAGKILAGLPDQERDTSLLNKIENKAQQHTVKVIHTDKMTNTVSNRRYTVIEHQYWEDGKGINKQLIPEILKATPDMYCMVHCMAGLGRTGTLIILKQMEKAADNGTLTSTNLVSFIAQAISDGRAMRNDGRFVQTPEQVQSLLDYGMQITGATVDNVESQLSRLQPY